ncbi:LPXTG cell wall anchor domain-containing protein [Ligilactobacillus murinus]|uniref:MucBP domain-containing protein n=3 Tax=Ligilactobacillus murinus TaxID=1622 RepID=UPI001071D9C6|nr:MucBP domain-containing protein [Ligilactobacillus murinus]MBF0758475.1 MucBP domain-containing protein [Ligilactobacillus murinus]TFU64064.1 LPXTG cell wall anchor domain-containing protein [Ligilactobacillus murinus]
MKRYKYDQLRKAQQEKLYYKMYKAGKNWIVMGLTVVGMGILFPSLAKADDQEETLNTEVVQEDPPSDQKQGMDNTENELRQLGPEEVIETDKQVQNSTSVVAEQANENTSEVLADNEQVVSTDLSADAQVETVSQETPQIEQSTPRSAFRSVDMRAAQEKSEVPNARTEQELKKYLESSNGLMAKNSLTTPILPNPTTSSATTEDTFDEDMLSRAPRPIKSEWRSLSHYAVYYPFVKKLQAAYQAKDFKEVMNNIALINAFKKRSRAEYKIGFKEADNYTADIALRDSERSAAVIISMDQDGHIITESRTRDNKPFYGYVTGSGTVYKLTDDKEYYQGSFSEQNGTASAKVEYQVGKNGAQDYNDYNGNIADKINNRPEAKLGQYDYVGTDYYYANAAHDLIKYNDNDPKKDKFAVTKMDDLANATPNDYTITLVVNHYRKANTTVEEAQTTITYKDDSGANVTPKTQVRVAGSVGSNVAIPAAPEVSGYTLKEIKFNGAVKHTGDKVTLDKSNTLEYVYKKVAEIATIDISYKAGTQELQPARPVILSGEVGSSVAIPVAPEISEYKLKEIKFNGVTKDADTQVTLDKTNKLEYIYDKNAVSAQVTISYRAGDKVLVPTKQVNLSGKVGDIVVIPAAPVIANYHFVGATIDGERIDPGMNTVLAATNELIYKYAEDAKLAHTTVMYKDTKGNVLNVSEPVSLTGNVGANVNLPAALTISGYTLDSIVFNQVPRRVGNTVSLAAENTLEYIYLKDPVVANITVSYRAGENVLTPTNEVKFSGNIDEEVRVPLAPDVRGYQFKKATFNGKEILPNASVTLAESNTLIYNYERLRIPAKVTFEYVNEAGQTVKPIGAATLIGKIGDTVKLGNAPLLLKHQLKEIRFNGTVKTVGDSVTLEPENTVIYVYMAKEEKPATVTVSYKDDQGNNVAPNTQVAVRGNVGAKVNVPQAPEVSGYHVVGITFNGQNVTANSQVTLSKQNELVYNYAADVKPAKITLSYKDDQGNAVTPNGQVTINGDTGAKLNLPEGPSVTGYTLKEVKFNGVTKAVGDEVSLAETNTVEYIYSKVVEAAQTTVSYKAGSQTLTPASPVSVTGNVGDKVNVPQAPEVSGYHVVGITFNGQKVEATNQVTLSKQNELVYNYAADVKPAKITLSYKDDQGNAVTPNGQVTINGDTGAKLNLPEGPSVTGYTLKEVKFNGVTKAVGDEVSLAETNTVEYIYSKVVEAAQTTVSYKAGSQTVTPASPVNVTGNVGDKVNVPQAPEVSGYHVVGITFNGQNVTSGSEVTLTKQNELVYNYETKLVDEHVLQLNIIDDTTQKVLENGVVLGKGLLNEPVAKDVVDKYNAKFEELRTKGYDVRSYDELPADYTADKTLTIHVTHGTKEVAGSDRTVNVLLEYVYGNGPKQGSFASEPYKEEHTFTSINVVDKVTGEIVETKWSLPTASPVIKTPKVEGYVADKATVKIPDITPDSKDVKLNVTYLTILPKENIKIEWGHALAAKDVIIVPEKLENLVINQTWKLVPDFKPTSLTNRLTSGIVTVTLSDGTKLDVEVEIEVAKLSESNEPKVDQVTISKDKQLDPKQVVNNLAELPDRTQLEWVKEPTALADGVLNVKYPDGSNDLVEVKVKKTAIADDATQTPKDINEAGIKSTLEIKTTDQTETEMPKTTELPQTSDKIDNTAGILGIVVATLGGLLGFGTTKHKKKS